MFLLFGLVSGICLIVLGFCYCGLVLFGVLGGFLRVVEWCAYYNVRMDNVFGIYWCKRICCCLVSFRLWLGGLVIFEVLFLNFGCR